MPSVTGSATEPGAKDTSDRRPQPSRPIIGWLGRGEIAFAKFSGEDADMPCIDHRQPVDLGKPGQWSGGRACDQHLLVAKGGRAGKFGTKTFLGGPDPAPSEDRSPPQSPR